MSTHGHKGVQDLLRGSVANEVRHRTTVPVLMVRGVAATDRSPREREPRVARRSPARSRTISRRSTTSSAARSRRRRTTSPLRLDISPASVSGMVRRLADQGLITHEPYRGVRLTEDGRRAALRTLRRHRILECYLTEVLGYPWDRVHDEAEQLEHAASEELIERMASRSAIRRTIRTARRSRRARAWSRRRRCALSATRRSGEQVRVRQVMDKDAERLRYLAELGIRPGALRAHPRPRAVRRADHALGGRSGGGVTRVIGPALADAGVRRAVRRGLIAGGLTGTRIAHVVHASRALSPEERVTARPNP